MVRYLLALVLLITTSAEAAIIRLKSNAMVENAIVRLEDVAEVFEEDAGTLSRLKAVTIEPAPIPGAQRKLSLQLITDRIRAHSIDLSSIEFSGRTVVLVGRKARAAQARKKAATESVAVEAEPQKVTVSKPVEAEIKPIKQVADEQPAKPQVVQANRHLKLTAKEMRDAEKLVYELVREYLTEHATNWGTPRITAHVPTYLVPKLLDAPVGGLRIRSGKPLNATTFSLEVEIKNEFGKTEVITVTADVIKRPKAVVTTRALPAGHVLQASDLRLEEVDAVQREATEFEQVLGKETKSKLGVGQRVLIESITEPTLIRRGDKIKGEVVVGTIRVVQEFKALKDGRLNDVIDMETIPGPGAPKNERPERRQGTVVGNKQIEVFDAPEGAVRTGLQVMRRAN